MGATLTGIRRELRRAELLADTTTARLAARDAAVTERLAALEAEVAALRAALTAHDTDKQGHRP